MAATTTNLPAALTINVTEAHWVVKEITAILNRMEPDSPIALVLRQTRSELVSLAASAEAVQCQSESQLAAA
ncbi:MAG: hypothetical protein LC104_03320 [Bacteroidales bacterium]|nr:hypothetical protein [Bacteroidales bacterium]